MDDLVGNLLGCSQPAALIIAALDKGLNATSNLADETAPELEIEVVIVAQRSTPVFLRGRGTPPGQVGNKIHDSSVSFFQSNRLQFLESRRVLKRKLEPIGLERSKIGSKEQFGFRRSGPRGSVKCGFITAEQ